MNKQTTSTLGLVVLAGFSLGTPAFASVIIDWVAVGNPGNAADTAYGHYGAVGYAYDIDKNETTIGQYSAFLNAAAKTDPYNLYNPSMGSNTAIAGITRSGASGSYTYAAVPGTANQPITYVSLFDAARFCNWLHNGQGTGSTETGAYTLNGAMSGVLVAKNVGAKVWIPGENEWYKAAYYDPTKNGTGGYWLYPTGSNSIAGSTPGVADSANYNNPYAARPLTDVGAYGANSASFYGTNDQGGNVNEWIDAVGYASQWKVRGAGWNNSIGTMASTFSSSFITSDEYSTLGFRVAGSELVAVPEPGSWVALGCLLGSGVFLRSRRKR